MMEWPYQKTVPVLAMIKASGRNSTDGADDISVVFSSCFSNCHTLTAIQERVNVKTENHKSFQIDDSIIMIYQNFLSLPFFLFRVLGVGLGNIEIRPHI